MIKYTKSVCFEEKIIFSKIKQFGYFFNRSKFILLSRYDG